MLAMDAQTMAGMETSHLLDALEAEGHLTPAEKELAKRLDALTQELDALAESQETAFKTIYAALQGAGFEFE